MKTITFLSAIIFINMAFTQNEALQTTGLYLTSSDFVQHKLTYEMDCNHSKDKLKINELFGTSHGYVIYKGEKHAFDRSQIFGYRSCNNKNYRFFNNEIYQIIDTLDFYMYYQYKSEELNKGKGLVKTDEYYFSRNGNDGIEPLNSDNLKRAFPGNARFHYALDANFKSDKDLMAYDPYQKIYKIKYLYNESLNR
jgi:hypothetical protein